MTWTGWVALIIYVVVFCLGPMRRQFWANWRFCLPASVVGWLAFFLMAGLRGPGDPWWAPAIVSLMVGAGAGAACKRWLDRELGRGE